MILFVVLPVLAVVWAISGGFGLYVASSKNRSPTEGFLFGFFLGPLGVLVEALLPDGEASAPASTDDAEDQPSFLDRLPPPKRPKRGWELPNGATEEQKEPDADPRFFDRLDLQ